MPSCPHFLKVPKEKFYIMGCQHLQHKNICRATGLDNLKEEFSINCVEHPDGRVICNYDMINSRPKDHKIVREARALTLDSRDWSLISRSFFRFLTIQSV